MWEMPIMFQSGTCRTHRLGNRESITIYVHKSFFLKRYSKNISQLQISWRKHSQSLFSNWQGFLVLKEIRKKEISWWKRNIVTFLIVTVRELLARPGLNTQDRVQHACDGQFANCFENELIDNGYTELCCTELVWQ